MASEIQEIQANRLFDFSGRTVIVTGGGVGIGKVYAKALGEMGANVVIADIKDKEGAETAEAINAAGGTATAVTTDVTDTAACDAMAATATETYGSIEGLLNNAGLFADVPKRDDWTAIPDEEWERVMKVNVKGIYNCCRAVWPQMQAQGYGKIVNIASTAWITGTTGRLHYAASKACVVGYTRSLSHDLGKHGICVNAISPGLTYSETIAAATGPEYWEKRKKAMNDTAAIARIQVPEDLVGLALFLLAPASDYVTGQNIVCDGGRAHI